MINISGKPLSPNCIDVLAKGLSFSPTYTSREFDTKIDLFRFYRNLHLKAWYSMNSRPSVPANDSANNDTLKTPFKPKSTFCPVVLNAIRTKNDNSPMARHFREKHNSDPSILRAIGIDHIPHTLRGGARQKQLNQRESFWIFKLKATQYPGVATTLQICNNRVMKCSAMIAE